MASSRPELKHVACARCRDRKVKCDGGKPGCKRCHRNGTPCRYVQGRKQQTKSEWLQHLRTFSSQPGRVDVKPNPASPASQPALPQTPLLRSRYLDDNSSYARSPSPYLFEHTAIGIKGSPKGSSFSSRISTGRCSGSTPSPPKSVDYGFMDQQSYLFQSSESFDNTNFASDLLTTANGRTKFPVYPALMRSYTPTSHAMKNASSYDGFLEKALSYDATPYVPNSAEAMDWNFMPLSEEKTHGYLPSDYNLAYS